MFECGYHHQCSTSILTIILEWLNALKLFFDESFKCIFPFNKYLFTEKNKCIKSLDTLVALADSIYNCCWMNEWREGERKEKKYLPSVKHWNLYFDQLATYQNNPLYRYTFLRKNMIFFLTSWVINQVDIMFTLT